MSWIVITWVQYNGGFEAEILYNPETNEYKKWDGRTVSFEPFTHEIPEPTDLSEIPFE